MSVCTCVWLYFFVDGKFQAQTRLPFPQASRLRRPRVRPQSTMKCRFLCIGMVVCILWHWVQDFLKLKNCEASFKHPAAPRMGLEMSNVLQMSNREEQTTFCHKRCADPQCRKGDSGGLLQTQWHTPGMKRGACEHYRLSLHGTHTDHCRCCRRATKPVAEFATTSSKWQGLQLNCRREA